MPIENLEEEGLAKNPNLQLAQWKFLVTTDAYKDDKELRQKILDFIKENGMYICKYLLNICLSWSHKQTKWVGKAGKQRQCVMNCEL